MHLLSLPVDAWASNWQKFSRSNLKSEAAKGHIVSLSGVGTNILFFASIFHLYFILREVFVKWKAIWNLPIGLKINKPAVELIALITE